MKRALTALACLFALPAHADKAQECRTTGQIAAKAQELRLEGKSEKRTVRLVLKEDGLVPPGYEDAVEPLVYYVFLQTDAGMEQDLGAAWEKACLEQ